MQETAKEKEILLLESKSKEQDIFIEKWTEALVSIKDPDLHSFISEQLERVKAAAISTLTKMIEIQKGISQELADAS
jgi:hypothetical protein